MISTPQVFIMYEPGTFGTMLSSILTQDDPKFISDHAHDTKTPNAIKGFHKDIEYESLSNKTDNELHDFFSQINQADSYTVHRLSSLRFSGLDFDKYFKSVYRIVLKPKKQDLLSYAKRIVAIDGVSDESFFMKHIKDKESVPQWFIEQLAYKEMAKYFEKHLEVFDSNAKLLPTTHTYIIDPLDLFDETQLSKLLDSVGNFLGKKFKLPSGELKKSYERNKKYFTK